MSDTDAATTDATDEAPAELPGDGLRESIVDALRADLGDALVDTHLVPQSDLWVRVTSEAWADAGAALESHGFDYFCFLSAIDWMPSPYGKGEEVPGDEPEVAGGTAQRDEGSVSDEAQAARDESEADAKPAIEHGVTGGDTRFQLFARVTDIRRHVGVTVKADVPESMTMPTWIPWFAGANWHERETHEMFGIGFDGHPDLRNIYLPGDFEGNPLRKDFPLLARMIKPWPGIVDVEPIPEPDEPAAGDGAVESAGAEVGEAEVNEIPQRAEGSASDEVHGGSGRTPPAGGPDHEEGST